MQQDSRGDSCGQRRIRDRDSQYLRLFDPQVEHNRSRGDSCGQSRGGDTQHLHLFGPQVEYNRTVQEIAVDKVG